ncbi:MAG: PAS domain-containing protein, partial [Clostridia bacterium]|nr:PAS domain-containing protein [Clostridia bacterium]
MKNTPEQLNMDARIIRDMSQGILTVDLDGRILSVNGTAEKILGKRREDLIGNLFTDCFNERVEDDAFNRTILNAIRGYLASTENIVPYYLDTETKLLNAMTSYLFDGGEIAGVIVVLNDVTVFGRLLSRDVLKELYGSPDGSALGGRKETVSILMSDLRGFTAISERMEPRSLL